MNKIEFLKSVAETTGLPASSVEKVLTAVSGELKKAAAAKADLVVPGIGKLTVDARSERHGKNPQTGAALVTPAKNIVKFKPAKDIRDAAPAVV